MLVKIGAAGINPVDTYIRSGGYARKPALPYTPGSDGAGVVHCVGDGVKQFKVSDIISEALNYYYLNSKWKIIPMLRNNG